MAKGRGNAVRVSGFRKIVEGAGLHGRHSRRDVAKAGQHHNPAFRTLGTQLGDKAQAAAIFQLHVKNGICRRCFANDVNALCDGSGVHHFKATGFHGASQACAKRRIIIENKQRIVGHALSHYKGSLQRLATEARYKGSLQGQIVCRYRPKWQLNLHFAATGRCIPV